MIYLGRFIWVADAAGGHWEAPAGTVAQIDLRPTASCAKAGVVEGWGLFDIPSNPAATASLIPLAASMDSVPTAQVRNKIASSLNITVGSTETLGDILWRILTVDRDLIGANMCPGVLPDKGMLRISLGQFKREKSFAVGLGVEWPGVQADLQRQYRQLYNAAQAGLIPPKHYLKVLDFWCEDYKTTDWSLFVPSDLPQEAPIPHSTTISESFNKADSTTLGPDLSWTELDAAFSVVSNQCLVDKTWGFRYYARAESDLSSADHYAQIDYISNTGGSTRAMEVCARFASAARTFYTFEVSLVNGANNVVKTVAGTRTYIGTGGSTVAFSPPDTFKIECNGSTITGYFNGTATGATATDTSITGNLRTGFGWDGDGTSGTVTYDNFSAADLAAAGAALAGNAQAQATAAGTLTTQIPLGGAALVVSSASAALTTQIQLAGNVAAVTLADGALTAEIRLSGAAIAQALAAAGLDTQILLAAAAIAQASASGSLASGSAALAGDAQAQATATGNLSTGIPLAGAAAGQSAAAGDLLTAIPLGGAAAAQALAQAELTTQIQLAGAAIAQALAQGSLDGTVSLAGAAQAQATAAASLTTQIPLIGNAAATAVAAGSLATQIPLAGAAASVVSGNGALTVAIRLNAAALAQALATGDLLTQIRLDGAALARTVASGALTAQDPPSVDPRFLAVMRARRYTAVARRRAYAAVAAARQFRVAA